MAEIRLSEITQTFNIGLYRLVEFLNARGVQAEMNPNARISDEYMPMIEEEFGNNARTRVNSEEVKAKLRELIEIGSKAKSKQEDNTTVETTNTDEPTSSSPSGWDNILDAHRSRRTVRGTVVKRHLHGVIVDINGFEAKLPTQNLCDSEDELDTYIGQTLDLKVIRIFENSKSAIVSHRQPKNRDWSRDTEEHFDQPIICSVNWFNDSYGVVTPCFTLTTEQIGKIDEIFIHYTRFDGDRQSIGSIDEQSLVLVSGVIKQPKKISATSWKKLEPDQNTIHHIAPFLGKVNADSYGTRALSKSFVGIFLTTYISNAENPFVDIFAEAFNGTPRERGLLFKWLRLLRTGYAVSKHNEYKQCIDNYLTRDEFYQGDIDLEEISSLAVSGELPLCVARPEHIEVSYNQVSDFIGRVIQELTPNTTLFEDCFRIIFDVLTSELDSLSNALKADSAGENRPVQTFGFSYSRSSSNIAHSNRKHLLALFGNAISSYKSHSVLNTIDTHELSVSLLDFYKTCLNQSETLDTRIEVRGSLECNDSFILSERDSFFEESLTDNIAVDQLIKAVASDRTTFKAWDRINGWDAITPELVKHIIENPEKFPEEHVRIIYQKVKQNHCLHKAYNLLTVLPQFERDSEISLILNKLKDNFVFSDYESLLQLIEPGMMSQECITDIQILASEFYIPAQISKIDAIASARGYNWIKGLYNIISSIPAVIHNSAYAPISTYVKDIIRKQATISEQFRAIRDNDLKRPESWSELANLHTINIHDINSLFDPYIEGICDEDREALIPLIKSEKKYKEALHLAQKIGAHIKHTTDLEIYNEVSYNEYIGLWLEGIGEQHDEALFVDGIVYCAADSAAIPENDFCIYEKCKLCLDKIANDFNADYRNAIIKLALEYLSPSTSRNHFQTFMAIIKYVKSHSLNIDLGDEDTDVDLKVALWFLDIGKKLSFTELKDYIVLFRPAQQQRVLKKVFLLYDKKGLTPKISNIYNLFEANPELLGKIDNNDNEGLFDLSCRVVLYSLNKYSQTGKFEFEKDIFLEILMKQLTKNAKVKYKISGFFSRCEGRTKGKYNFENYTGILTQVPDGFSITFDLKGDDLQQLVAILKTIPGRTYNSSTCAWFIPAQEKEKIMHFARRYRIRIDFGPSNIYDRNAHMIEQYRWSNPPDIVREFCDGVPYGEILSRVKIPIIWCGSERCYSHCRKAHSEKDWEDYTMLDFCRILGYNTDTIDKMGEIKKDGAYLMFVSWVNWFNMMLEHLYCNECGLILSPDCISSVGRYGVTEFSCRNKGCQEFKKSIYLNTCLNKNCRSVIDSRECKQCPNEWYICPTCGNCCSNDMISRRYHALSEHNQYINTPLRIAYAEKSGHFDSDTVFCYECGNQTEVHDGKYYCTHCRKFISYKNRQKNKRN